MSARFSGLLTRGAFLAACLGLLSCKTAGFKEVYMSTDSAGRLRTSTYPTEFVQADAGIFCQIRYSSGRDDAVLKTYITTPTEDFPAALVTGDSVLLSKGDGQLALQLGILTQAEDGKTSVVTAGPWEEGTYRLDFYIDDKKEDSVSFTIQPLEAGEEPPT